MQELFSRPIATTLIVGRMPGAGDFDDKFFFATNEVGEIGANRLLPNELEPTENGFRSRLQSWRSASVWSLRSPRARRGSTKRNPRIARPLSLTCPRKDGEREVGTLALHALDVPVHHQKVLVLHALALGDALLAALIRDGPVKTSYVPSFVPAMILSAAARTLSGTVLL